MKSARVTYLDGRVERIPLVCRDEEFFLAEAPDFSQVQAVDFFPEAFETPAGEEGYFVIPYDREHGKAGTGQVRFHPRPDCEMISPDAHSLPLMGAFRPEGAVAVVPRGGRLLVRFVAGVRAGVYYAYPRFLIAGEVPYEALSVRVRELPVGADYSDLANFYREMRIADGCVPLREKIKTRPAVKYAVEAPYLRVRLGWKPVPTPVMDQTPENEPEMTVVTTFARVGELIDGLKTHGVEKAEVCLVGWNAKGHDGRWPQMFPVEEKLGGEKELRRLIEEGKAKGFVLSAHTNSTDTYQISEDWNVEDVIRRKDGSLAENPNAWSSGRMYDVCYQRMMQYARRDFPRAAELGFGGLHYVDVISIVPPRSCYHPEHPLNVGESAGFARELAEYTRETFGGFSSEGGYDYLCAEMDYALNPVRGQENLNETPLFDRYLPLWHMVYHGILLYNVSGATLNYPIRGEKAHLMVLEHGARPTIYFNQIFGENWLQAKDFRCGTAEELEESARLVGKVYAEYKELVPLQYEFMVKHEVLPEDKVRVTYSDGSVMTVDYQNETWSLEKGKAFG